MSDDTEIDCTYVNFITCPYCGYVDEDYGDYRGLDRDGSKITTDCGSCNRTFGVEVDITPLYSSTKIDSDS